MGAFQSPNLGDWYLLTADIEKIVNQDWYSRRGYRGIKIVQNFFDVRDRSGKKWDTKAIFMRKDIS
ncbi:hypothetical protein N7454_004003 [Penicillium verhagenii]|nr:hypothetical protein N7454_004003 [Penicillium verhagenii]